MSENKFEQVTFEFEQKQPIKGYPELHWTGKRPYKSTVYYPAQLKEVYGEGKPYTDKDGKSATWLNKIFWGDNLQVMSHLLKEFRGQVDLIYIDPPFDSKADYKKKIALKGKTVTNDSSTFEEKQYGDIWTNDEYLQFMYERLTILNELLSEKGTIYLHCDWHKSHYIRAVMDEIFGVDKFVNEIAWCYEDIGSRAVNYFKRKHDTVLMYAKTNDRIFNIMRKRLSDSTIKRYQPYFDEKGQITYRALKDSNPGVFAKLKGIPQDLTEVWLDIENGAPLSDWWVDISPLKSGFNESTDYPTQKPEALLERVIKASSNPGDLVFDCFMGSGTTQSVAMKLGRRFIGADINLGAVQTTTKRLLGVGNELKSLMGNEDKYLGLEVYNVNNYDLFRNPIEARDLILEALEVEPFSSSNVYDGEKDGRMVKVMPVNRIATKADLQGILSNLPYKTFEEKKEKDPNETVLKLTLVCMGHEPDLRAAMEQELLNYKVDIKVVDILRDRSDIQFKRDAEADIKIVDEKLIIKNFYPLNLMQKLSLDKETVENWKQLVETVMIDFNYDGAVMQPTVMDIADKNGFVKGEYQIPDDAGTIRIKITDLLAESLEVEVQND